MVIKYWNLKCCGLCEQVPGWESSTSKALDSLGRGRLSNFFILRPQVQENLYWRSRTWTFDESHYLFSCCLLHKLYVKVAAQRNVRHFNNCQPASKRLADVDLHWKCWGNFLSAMQLHVVWPFTCKETGTKVIHSSNEGTFYILSRSPVHYRVISEPITSVNVTLCKSSLHFESNGYDAPCSSSVLRSLGQVEFRGRVQTRKKSWVGHNLHHLKVISPGWFLWLHNLSSYNSIS